MLTTSLISTVILIAALLISLRQQYLNYKKREFLTRDLESSALELRRREKRIREETEEELRKMAEQTEQLLQSRFTIIANKADISCTIDWDGNCTVCRAMDGLKVGDGLRLEFI